jgi:hypothetical protein
MELGLLGQRSPNGGLFEASWDQREGFSSSHQALEAFVIGRLRTPRYFREKSKEGRVVQGRRETKVDVIELLPAEENAPADEKV